MTETRRAQGSVICQPEGVTDECHEVPLSSPAPVRTGTAASYKRQEHTGIGQGAGQPCSDRPRVDA